MKRLKTLVDWHYTRIFGIVSVRLIKIWLRIHRSPEYRIELDRPIDPSEVTVIAANHQTLLDPPAIFAALKIHELLKISPVKFMTWHKYYNSVWKLPLYSTGCFPSHGEGLTGVKGAIHYAQSGYRSFLFPEGKRTNPENRGSAYPGISQVLDQLPKARLILAQLDWERRTAFWSKPKVLIHFFDAPDNLNRSDPNAIMDEIYAQH